MGESAGPPQSFVPVVSLDQMTLTVSGLERRSNDSVTKLTPHMEMTAFLVWLSVSSAGLLCFMGGHQFLGLAVVLLSFAVPALLFWRGSSGSGRQDGRSGHPVSSRLEITATALGLDGDSVGWKELVGVRVINRWLHIHHRGGQSDAIPCHEHSYSDLRWLTDVIEEHIAEHASEAAAEVRLRQEAERLKDRR